MHLIKYAAEKNTHLTWSPRIWSYSLCPGKCGSWSTCCHERFPSKRHSQNCTACMLNFDKIRFEFLYICPNPYTNGAFGAHQNPVCGAGEGAVHQKHDGLSRLGNSVHLQNVAVDGGHKVRFHGVTASFNHRRLINCILKNVHFIDILICSYRVAPNVGVHLLPKSDLQKGKQPQGCW